MPAWLEAMRSMLSADVWLQLADLTRLVSIIGLVVAAFRGVRYLKEIRDGMVRNIWQNDVMWGVFCIERDIPLESSRWAGTETGKEVAQRIIQEAHFRKLRDQAAEA